MARKDKRKPDSQTLGGRVSPGYRAGLRELCLLLGMFSVRSVVPAVQASGRFLPCKSDKLSALRPGNCWVCLLPKTGVTV